MWLQAGPFSKAAVTAGVAAVVGLAVCLAVLRLTARWLLVPELRQILLARAGSAQIARHLCTLLGLRASQS